MLKRRICLFAAGLGLCCLGGLAVAAEAAPASSAPQPAVASPSARTAPLGGVNIVGLYPDVPLARADSEIAAARKLHAKVVRAELPWSVVEPYSPGVTDPQALAFVDRLFADAAAAGIRVIALVDSTPCWDSSAPAALMQTCNPSEFSQANNWPPRDPSQYGSFAAYLAQRYGTRLAAIQVWNEPDQANELYFAGPEKAVRYAAVLRAAYVAVKQADPQVPVLAGSLVGSNGAFLRDLYAAGIKGYYDGLSVDFYTLVLASLRSIHEVQLANGDTTPLWLTEFGWTSCYPKARVHEEQACVTPQVQATNIADVVHSLARTPYIAAEVVYDLQDSSEEQFGLLTASGAHKPAWGALAGALASPFSNPSPIRLSLQRRGGRVLASGSGPVGDFMELEAFKGGRLRYRAVFTMDRFNRFAIQIPRVLGTHGLRVRVYQYWSGPARAAQRSI